MLDYLRRILGLRSKKGGEGVEIPTMPISISRSPNDETWCDTEAQLDPTKSRHLLSTEFARDMLGLDTSSRVSHMGPDKPDIVLFWKYQRNDVRQYTYQAAFWYDSGLSCNIVFGGTEQDNKFKKYPTEFSMWTVGKHGERVPISKKSAPFRSALHEKSRTRSFSWLKDGRKVRSWVVSDRKTTASDHEPSPRKATTVPITPKPSTQLSTSPPAGRYPRAVQQKFSDCRGLEPGQMTHRSGERETLPNCSSPDLVSDSGIGLGANLGLQVFSEDAHEPPSRTQLGSSSFLPPALINSSNLLNQTWDVDREDLTRPDDGLEPGYVDVGSGEFNNNPIELGLSETQQASDIVGPVYTDFCRDVPASWAFRSQSQDAVVIGNLGGFQREPTSVVDKRTLSSAMCDESRQETIMLHVEPTSTVSYPLNFLGQTYELSNADQQSVRWSTTVPDNRFALPQCVDQSRARGKEVSLAMERFLVLPDHLGSHRSVAGSSNDKEVIFDQQTLGNQGSKHMENPDFRSVRRIYPTVENPIDLTPAPNADEYWTVDETGNGYIHVDSETGSVYRYKVPV